MSEYVVDLLATEWNAISELGATLTDDQWDRPTECPGWTVKDNVSHIIGTERSLLGEVPPNGYDDQARAPHVKNAIGELNERWIAARRGRSGPEILNEFCEVTELRLGALRAMGEAELAKKGWTPVGQAPYREFMAIRVMDCWAHEQDIRRATAKEGNLTGPVAEHSLARVEAALPYVIGKKAAAPEASTVFIDLTGPITKRTAVVVENRRAKVADSRTADTLFMLNAATCVLTMSSEALCCLGFGRWDPGQALSEGRVAISGDQDLARRVVLSLPFMI